MRRDLHVEYHRGAFGCPFRRTTGQLGADDYRRRYLGDATLAGYAFYPIAIADVAEP